MPFSYLFILIIFSIGFASGTLGAFFICKYILYIRIKEVEDRWNKVCQKYGEDWTNFHQAEQNRWIEKTNDAVKQAAHDAAVEMDRRWRGQNNVKPKPKPPSN